MYPNHMMTGRHVKDRMGRLLMDWFIGDFAHMHLRRPYFLYYVKWPTYYSSQHLISHRSRRCSLHSSHGICGSEAFVDDFWNILKTLQWVALGQPLQA